MKKSFYNLLAFLTLTACSSEYPMGNQSERPSDLPIFQASLEKNNSRIHLTSAFSIHWNEGDRISVFAKSHDNLAYSLTDGANSNQATFQATEGTKSQETTLPFNGAIYPYDASHQIKTVENGCEFTFTIPFEQTYTSESFDKSAFPMLAISKTTSLPFRNICGILLLQLTGKRKIATIELRGNNHETLAGLGKGTLLTNGSLTWTPEASNASASSTLSNTIASSTSSSITLTCPHNGGVQLTESPTPFVLTLAPVTFTQGFEVVLTDTEGRKKTLRKRSTQHLVSNQLLRMPVVHCAFSRATLKAGKDLIWELPEHASIRFQSGQSKSSNPSSHPSVSTPTSELPAYLVKEGTTCTLTTSADDLLLNPDCSEMFKQVANLTTISFDACNTQHVENLNSLFKGCTHLTQIDLKTFDTHNVRTASGFTSMFEQVGTSTPEGCTLTLGTQFVVPTPENTVNMFTGANLKSITCTPELQQFLLKHANRLGLRTHTAAGPITWYNLYTGQPMAARNELIITHEQNPYFAPQLLGNIVNARIQWGDNQTETYQKDATHTYTTPGEHQVTLESQGAEGITFTTLKGIKKINFSKF